MAPARRPPVRRRRSRFSGLTKLMGDLEARGLVSKTGEGESVCYHINDGDEKHCFLNLLVSWWDALDAARRHAPLQPPRWAWAPAYARIDQLVRHPFSVAILRDTREPDHSMAERFANVGVASRAARSNPDGLLSPSPWPAAPTHPRGGAG